MRRFATTAALVLAAAAPLPAQERASADAGFVGADGAERGAATLTETPQGVLIRLELTGLPEGPHGLHFHETGLCEPPFDSAGGHFNPDGAAHGFHAPEGPHAGDLPNLHVPASGELTAEVFTTFVSLDPANAATLLDEDGSALIVHAGPDDHQSQPSGDSGGRIACAVVQG